MSHWLKGERVNCAPTAGKWSVVAWARWHLPLPPQPPTPGDAPCGVPLDCQTVNGMHWRFCLPLLTTSVLSNTFFHSLKISTFSKGRHQSQKLLCFSTYRDFFSGNILAGTIGIVFLTPPPPPWCTFKGCLCSVILWSGGKLYKFRF